jgi:multiple sugar transport system permease protein
METTLEQQATREQTIAEPRAPRHFLSPLQIVAWLLLVAMSILFIVPFLWMFSTSLKDVTDLANPSWIPDRIVWSNYSEAFSFGLWPQWAMNTVIITVAAVVGNVLSTALVAYAFARLRWPGRDQLFGLVLATMMLPGIVVMIPKYILFSKLPAFGFMGSETWINTFLPMIVPAFTGNAFYIFLTRQFMRGIPMELSEAAKIDGASEFRILASIIMPLTKPALAAVAIFSFQGAWEDFLDPLLYLKSEPLYTLQLGLRTFEFAAGGAPHWPWMMAASLVVMLPVVIVFIMFQRYFIEGVTLTGMGGR